jgi:hypothetical protein
MLKGFHRTGYFLAFLALCGSIGWVLIVASERPLATTEYQKRLNVMAANVLAPADAPDDSLKIYAVNVVHSRPFKRPFIGYGIYLGNGAIITAAHVVGRWPFFLTNPRVFIAGQDLPAKVVKDGSLEQTDLAVLSVDQVDLPVSLRLRRNPLCKEPLQVGTNVTVVYPDRTVRSQIISPLLIAPQFRMGLGTLINEAEGSGSGVFHAGKKCFLGIISMMVEKYSYRNENGRTVMQINGYAGYFVPVFKITDFIPPEFRF